MKNLRNIPPQFLSDWLEIEKVTLLELRGLFIRRFWTCCLCHLVNLGCRTDHLSCFHAVEISIPKPLRLTADYAAFGGRTRQCRKLLLSFIRFT